MQDDIFIRRCFELALLGAGHVSPNPLVGAVLVHENRIIGEGWHQGWGKPHAEVNCLHQVAPANRRYIPFSTLYCNLEPCSHFGKTPPCADLILEHKIPRVVISNVDPNPLVAGRGIAKLRQAGVSVVHGILEEEGQWLNRMFFTWIRENRPYVVLKWAQSADGFLGRAGKRTRISGSATQRLVHRWRSEIDAILVGTQTALTDNPRLDVRYYGPPPPLRIALDAKGDIPANYHLFDGSVETWIFGKERPSLEGLVRFFPSPSPVPPQSILSAIKAANRGSLLVEGGARLLTHFLESGNWDEIRLIENFNYLGSGIKAPSIPEQVQLRTQFHLEAERVRIFARSGSK